MYPITKATNVEVDSGTYGYGSTNINVLQTALNNIVNVLSEKAPTSHASTSTIYGAGDVDNYGHVKLTDSFTSVSSSQKAANSIGASAYAVQYAYDVTKERVGFAKYYIAAGSTVSLSLHSPGLLWVIVNGGGYNLYGKQYEYCGSGKLWMINKRNFYTQNGSNGYRSNYDKTVLTPIVAYNRKDGNDNMDDIFTLMIESKTDSYTTSGKYYDVVKITNNLDFNIHYLYWYLKSGASIVSI